MEPNETDLKNINVAGTRLPAQNLYQILTSEKFIILHFLRHLDCIYCQSSVDELYKLKQKSPGFPTIVFVHQSSPERAEPFFEKHFPNAPHISDPKLSLYQRYDVNRASYLTLFNLRSVLKGLWLTFKGYVNTNPMNNDDVLILSATFLYREGRLAWKHRAQYAGDDPNWAKLS